MFIHFLYIACNEEPTPVEEKRIEGTEVGDCTDGADNDADGWFDCDDDGCTNSPDCQETNQPAQDPSSENSSEPTTEPSEEPSAEASSEPSTEPSSENSSEPSNEIEDQDQDGFGSDIDCDDSDPLTFPGSAEIDSETLCMKDSDEDGFGDNSVLEGISTGSDCDDQDNSVYPFAPDIWYDGIDSDCQENDDYDQDSDGYTLNAYSSLSSLPIGDCDDEDNSVYPFAPDIWYDGIDSDCQGNNDYDQDGDGDAIEVLGGDCNDLDPTISSLVDEIWYDGIDQNCDDWDDWDSDYDGIDDRAVDLTDVPHFVMELFPIGDSNGNVIQGLGVDLDRRELWVSQDMGSFTEDVLINRISLETGHTQYCEEYGGSLALGHGQDLSIEYTSTGSRMLWIGSESDRGVTRVDPETKTIVSLSNLLPSGYSHSTPAMGLNNQWLAVRGSQDGNSTSNDWIHIYDKTEIQSAFVTNIAPPPLYAFNIDAAQRVDSMWFQGIALDEELGLVYALTGNSSLSQDKLLYVYDLSGNVLQTLSINVDNAVADAVGSKYEPEGLSLVKDPITEQRYLYFTLMFGSSGNNIKRMYVISPPTEDMGGGQSGNEMLWTLWYNGSSGDVEIASMLKNGRKGCVVKDSTWSTGWTSFEGYYSGGDPHLMLQKTTEGTAKIHPLDWDGYMNSATKDDEWSSGWDSFESWEQGGNTYLFYYKSGASYSGLARVSELTTDGDTCCRSENEYWSTGWMTKVYSLSNGSDYLFRYMPSTGQIRIMSLGAGFFGSEITNGYWPILSYSAFDTAHVGGSSYFFRLDSSGNIDILPIEANGDLGSNIDIISTNTTDWTHMSTYNLEEQLMIYVYRSSDGYFEVYEVDENGLSLGLFNSGLQPIGLTGIQHFTTNP